VAELWDFANELNPISYPQGIFKFKTLEDANRQRERVEIERAKNVQVNKIGLKGK